MINRPRALDYLQKCGLDALVATSPVNITYFTGFYSWLGGQFKEFMVRPGGSGDLLPSFALFSASGESALAIEATWACNTVDLQTDEVRYFGGAMLDHSIGVPPLAEPQRKLHESMTAVPYAESAVDALVDLLNGKSLSNGCIGIELDGLPATTRKSVEEALPKVRWKDCSNLIRLIRMVKTEEEIAELKQATKIAEDAALTSLAEAGPGHSVLEMRRRFQTELASRGAESDHFAYSIKGMGIATETDYRLEADDVLYVDYGCVYRYGCSDSGLTLALTPLTEAFRRKYDAIYECLQAGREAMRPGAKASSVPDAMWDVLHAHDVEVSFPHGHGIGLEVRDYPILVADTGLRVQDDCVDEPADLTIEENMVLNLEAPIFMPGTASLHIEQTFLVEAGGGVLLTPQERGEPFSP